MPYDHILDDFETWNNSSIEDIREASRRRFGDDSAYEQDARDHRYGSVPDEFERDAINADLYRVSHTHRPEDGNHDWDDRPSGCGPHIDDDSCW
ncbi:MAG: hypothetical protein SCH71_06550 [Desulfobulbaceae bacterium]|nr:hypothetical protein [Desulfobulbaceae bacterium]